MPRSYGPSDAAASAHRDELHHRLREGISAKDARAALDEAHDPALGLDRSVCLRDVVEALRAEAERKGFAPGYWWPLAANFIEQESLREELSNR